MKVLVINCGSSSLKYQLFNMDDETVLAKGLVEKIHLPDSVLHHNTAGKQEITIKQPISDHTQAIELMLAAMLDRENGAISDLSEIDAVGHRVVHGGSYFKESSLINDAMMARVKELVELAPLHNPAGISGIEACMTALPDVPMVGVFDTAFHSTMPEKNYMYAIPYEYYEKYGIRRYGFHGTSHKYVSQRLNSLIGAGKKIIPCHLGSGSSIAAINSEWVEDTSMGFTPLQGLVMGTRCGDVDPSIITFLMEKENLTSAQLTDILNKKSGLLGLSGVSSDLRAVEAAAKEGNERAQMALNVFKKSVIRYIGAYSAELQGVDAIVFTAGIGENSSSMRKEICHAVAYLGIEIDDAKNKLRGEEVEITTPDSKVRVFVIPTNEELMIARDTKEVLTKKF